MINTGEIVRAYRDRLHWSRAYLSDKSGVSVCTIVRIESNGDCMVSTFEKLIDAMGYGMQIKDKRII